MDKSMNGIPPLRAVRQARGLGLREVARAADIDPSHLSRVERGKGSLSIEKLAQLAVVLELRELTKLLTPYRPTKGGEQPLTRSARAKPGRKSKT
jgi:transcriptional regulator with XRE-family HTH domain